MEITENNDNLIENIIIMTYYVRADTVYTINNDNDNVHRQWLQMLAGWFPKIKHLGSSWDCKVSIYLEMMVV